MKEAARLPLGVVLERRQSKSRWISHVWLPVAVIPGAAPLAPEGPWTALKSGEDWEQFHAGTLTMELFPKETEGYRLNLSQDPPRLFVVLRRFGESDPNPEEHEVRPFLVTASPYEAQDYLDSGEEIIEPVTMPEAVIAFVQEFVDRHHVDEVFKKRKRRKWAESAKGVGLRSSTGPARVNGSGSGPEEEADD